MVYNKSPYYMTNSYRPGIKKFDWFKAGLSIPIQPGTFHTSPGCPAPMFAESVYRVNMTNKLEQYGSRKALQKDY